MAWQQPRKGMTEMRIVFRDLASSLNCPTPSPSAATPAASHIALSIDENLTVCTLTS